MDVDSDDEIAIIDKDVAAVEKGNGAQQSDSKSVAAKETEALETMSTTNDGPDPNKETKDAIATSQSKDLEEAAPNKNEAEPAENGEARKDKPTVSAPELNGKQTEASKSGKDEAMEAADTDPDTDIEILEASSTKKGDDYKDLSQAERDVLDQAFSMDTEDNESGKISGEALIPESILNSALASINDIMGMDTGALPEASILRSTLSIARSDDDDDLEVIEVDDKPTNRKRRVGKKCCNPDCGTSSNLHIAPIYALNYYRIEFQLLKVAKICETCLFPALQFTEALTEAAEAHRPVVNEKIKIYKPNVVSLDTDESDDDEEELRRIDEDSVETEISVEEAMSLVMKKYDVGFQIEESHRILAERTKKNKASVVVVDEMFTKLEKSLDSLRDELYRDFQPRFKELPELQITDVQSDDSSAESGNVVLARSYYQSFKSRHSGDGENQGPGRRKIPGLKRKYGGVAMKKVTQIRNPQSPGEQPEIVRLNEVNPEKDVVQVDRVPLQPPPLPPQGPMLRPKLKASESCYAMRQSCFTPWAKAHVLEAVHRGTESTYKIKFDIANRKYALVKVLSGKHLAYYGPAVHRIPVGARVVAVFQDDVSGGTGKGNYSYYSGIVAEPPKVTNKFRYLVFFDDGYAQYVPHDLIRLVTESSKEVWEDVHPDSQIFIQKYLEVFPERPMVKLQPGQVVKTEWNAKWWVARVEEVDASLVKMHFDADNRTEWIYRGSTRLGPLFSELANAEARKESGGSGHVRRRQLTTVSKQKGPYVEYTRIDEVREVSGDEDLEVEVLTMGANQTAAKTAVARKSTAKKPQMLSIESNMSVPGLSTLNTSPVATKPSSYEQPLGEHEGVINYVQNQQQPHVKFYPHMCDPSCLRNHPYNMEEMKENNPLAVPILCGWKRQLVKYRMGKRQIIYHTPCGRRLRSIEEVHLYLRITNSTIGIDLFCFDFWVHAFAQFHPPENIFYLKDLSYGKENVPVSCVNCLDRSYPEYLEYRTQRMPTEGVHLNLDEEFLIGCSCTDDCQSKDKCACWQLTIQGTTYCPGATADPNVGFVYRRLLEPVVTGIYECNARCKCRKTCLNRVVQNPLQLQLQVFKTQKRGWGIRCLHDIPRGGFICIYAGQLLTEQGANEGGKTYGDEYLAELDYIEVVERFKEGYESDVVDDMGGSDSHRQGSDGKKAVPKNPNPDEGDDSDKSDGGTTEEEWVGGSGRTDSDEEFRIPGGQASQATVTGGMERATRSKTGGNGKRRTSGESGGEPVTSTQDEKGEAQKEGADEEKGARSKVKKSESGEDGSGLADEEDSNEAVREPSRFSALPDAKSKPDKQQEQIMRHKFVSVRNFFGNEEVFIMDAKTTGNIGRYLNHSCSPNVFVQNVFVDTQDLRFPWVAFFALTYIRAGTELTWDYNYDVGSVPGKVMYCYCGSTDCRGRLL